MSQPCPLVLSKGRRRPNMAARRLRWGPHAVKALIRAVGQSDDLPCLMSSSTAPNEAAWMAVLLNMGAAGRGRTIQQVRAKWKTIKAAFHVERDHRVTTGRPSTTPPPHYLRLLRMWQRAGRPSFRDRHYTATMRRSEAPEPPRRRRRRGHRPQPQVEEEEEEQEEEQEEDEPSTSAAGQQEQQSPRAAVEEAGGDEQITLLPSSSPPVLAGEGSPSLLPPSPPVLGEEEEALQPPNDSSEEEVVEVSYRAPAAESPQQLPAVEAPRSPEHHPADVDHGVLLRRLRTQLQQANRLIDIQAQQLARERETVAMLRRTSRQQQRILRRQGRLIDDLSRAQVEQQHLIHQLLMDLSSSV